MFAVILGCIGYTGYFYFDNVKCYALYKSDYELFDDEEAKEIMKADIVKWTKRGIILYSILFACSCISFIGQIIIAVFAVIQSPRPRPQLDTRIIPIPKLGFFGELLQWKIFQIL